MNYYAFHIGDYVSDTQHLSWDEDAAYRRLLDVYYRAEEPLPLDMRDLLRKVRATTDAQRDAVAAVLEEFFERTDKGWVNRRAEAEVEAVRGLREAQSLKARRRWEMARAEAAAKAVKVAGEAAMDAAASPAHAAAMPPIPTPTPIPTPVPEAPHSGVQGGAAPPAPEPAGRPTRREREAATIAAMELPAWMPRPAWDDFAAMRLGKGRLAPCTPAAMQAIVQQLGTLRDAGHDPAAVLRHSVANGWPGVFAPDAPGTGARAARRAAPPGDDWTMRAR